MNIVGVVTVLLYTSIAAWVIYRALIDPSKRHEEQQQILNRTAQWTEAYVGVIRFGKHGRMVTYYFWIHDKYYETWMNSKEYKTGDTLLIRYAESDPMIHDLYEKNGRLVKHY
jgi:hypothetical protein